MGSVPQRLPSTKIHVSPRTQSITPICKMTSFMYKDTFLIIWDNYCCITNGKFNNELKISLKLLKKYEKSCQDNLWTSKEKPKLSFRVLLTSFSTNPEDSNKPALNSLKWAMPTSRNITTPGRKTHKNTQHKSDNNTGKCSKMQQHNFTAQKREKDQRKKKNTHRHKKT